MAAVPSPVGRPSFAGGRARAPQAAATEGLYERHSAKILSYCLHQLGSREEAEDAVQTTFMNAFRALGRGVVPEAESAWLFKIAENVCLSRRRSSWRRGRIESPSDFDVIEEIVPGPSRQRDELIGIEDALASMPEQQRRAILLREWQGLSYREISEELELSQSAVETLIFRARRSLAQGLEQPDLLKKPKRKSFRRALHALDLGTIAAAAKTLLAGSVAAKATVAAVAVTAAATAASVTPKLEGHSPQPAAPTPAVVVPAATPSAPDAVSAAAAALASVTAVAHDAQAVAPEPSTAGRGATAAPKPATPRPAPTAAAPAAAPAAPAAAPPVAHPAEPPAAAPAPVAPEPSVTEQPVLTPGLQPKHEPTPVEPATAGGKTDEGKAKQREPKGRGSGNDKGRGDELAPIGVVAPVEVAVPAPTAPDQSAAKETKDKERGRDKNRRDLAQAPSTEPATETVATVEPAAAAPAAPAAEAPAAEPTVAFGSGPRRKK